MKDRLLYQIRNVGRRRASHSAVIDEEPMVLEISDPEIAGFLAQVKVEDLTIPSHANVGTTRAFQAELPEIIAGTSAKWHLWEVQIYRNRLVLHYANRQDTGRYPKAAALKCYLEWPADLEMQILVPDEQRTCYRIRHLAPDERFDLLQVEYDDDETGLINTESYETGPRRR